MQSMRRFDALSFAVALALGFALWQAVQAVTSSVVNALIQIWDSDDFSFAAHFTVKGVDFEYSHVLGSLATLVILGLLFLGFRRRVDRAPAQAA
jgi:large-conductance mechanosensitive channel